MARPIVWTAPAADDLEAAVEFIARDSEAYACTLGSSCSCSKGRLWQRTLRGKDPTDKSCDVTLGPAGDAHVLWVFQDGGERGSLQLWLWFDELAVRTPAGKPISLDGFIAGGRRWWDGFHAGDARASAPGLFPLKAAAIERPQPDARGPGSETRRAGPEE